MPARRLLALVAFCFVVLTGCQVQMVVDIAVSEDGSGVVEASVSVDDDARRRLGDIDAALRTADLEATGWEVSRPELREDGRTWYVASKPFANPEQLQTVLDELTGPDGIFKAFEIVRETGDNSRTMSLSGVVDLTEGIDAFADDGLAGLIDDPPLGVPLDLLEDDLGTTLDRAVAVRVQVQLPGQAVETVTTRLGERATIEAELTEENQWGVVLNWVGYALAGLFVLSVVLAGTGLYLERNYEDDDEVRTPTPVRDRVPSPDGVVAAAAPGATSPPRAAEPPPPAPEPDEGGSRLQLVVIAAPRLVFEGLEARERWLAGFVRERGSVASDAEILAAYGAATLGQLTSAELWNRLQVPGDPELIDAEFLSPVRARPAAKEFVQEMRRRSLPVAVVGNDVSSWSHQLRAIHGFGGVDHWIASGDIGVRAPDPAFFEAVRAAAGASFARTLVLSADPAWLDVARNLGMITAQWADRRPEAEAAGAHPVVTSFNDFFRRRRQPEPAGRRRG